MESLAKYGDAYSIKNLRGINDFQVQFAMPKMYYRRANIEVSDINCDITLSGYQSHCKEIVSFSYLESKFLNFSLLKILS